MVFHSRDERVLARIEASLTGSDPGLAAQFDHFNRVTASFPRRRGPHVSQRWAAGKLVTLLLLPLAALAVWAIVTATARQGGTHGCSTARVVACRPGNLHAGEAALWPPGMRVPSSRIQSFLNAP
jgi:hypothetical protein